MSKKLVLWENFNIRMILKELLKLKKITSIWSVTVSGIPLSGSRFFKEWEAYAMQSLLNWRTHQDESWAAPLSFCWKAFEMGGEFAFLTLSQGTLMVLVSAALRTSGRGNNSESGRRDMVSLVLDSRTCEILSKFLKCPGLGLLTCKTGWWPGQSLKFPSSSNAFWAEF